MEKIKQYWQKFGISEAQFSVQFFVACLVLTVAFFLAFASSFKTYTSSITILVNIKSEMAANQEKQIMANVLEFPRMLSFYDRLLKYNPDVRDVAQNQNQTERKEAWNRMLTVKKISRDSSLLKISIETKQKNDAEQLTQKTARTLFDTVGMYYNSKNDVDLRIVDGPISHRNIFGWWWMLPFSVVLAFLVTIFLQKMIAKSIDIFDKQENFLKNKNFFAFSKKPLESPEAEIETLKELYMNEQVETILPPVPEKIDAEKFQEMKNLTKMTEQDKYPNFREVPKYAEPKAAAPDNLPIADDSFFMQTAAPEIKQAPEQSESKKQEPTAEELRERLNKLLRGEL